MDEIKNKIRPIYSELRGYLSVAPEGHTIIKEMATNLSTQFNGAIDELNELSGQNYDKFRIQLSSRSWNGERQTIIESLEYRNKLSGLINRLQGEFFSEEQILSQGPNTVINASQIQYQQQSITVDIAMLIAEKRMEYKAGSAERNFLDKLGEGLKTAKGVQDIIQMVISIASATGVGLEFLKKVFGA